jgi:hypothetical protein
VADGAPTLCQSPAPAGARQITRHRSHQDWAKP